MVLDPSISFSPFLVVVLFEVVVGGADGEHADHLAEFELFVGLVEQNIVFSVHDSVTVGAVLSENLEASSDGTSIVVTPEGELRPLHDTVMGADLGDLFFVSLDSPEGTNVVSVQPGLSDLDVLHKVKPHGCGC